MAELNYFEQASLTALGALLARGSLPHPDELAELCCDYAKALCKTATLYQQGETPEVSIWYGGERIKAKDFKLKDSELPNRAIDSLNRMEIYTLSDLLNLTKHQFMDVPGIGELTRKAIHSFLKEHGLCIHGCEDQLHD